MKKLLFTLSALSAAVLIRSFGPAHAADDAKAEITALEHKAIAATNADEFMAFADEKNVVFYDYVRPLQYVGAKAVRGTLDNFFNNAKNVKGTFVALDVVADGRVGIARSLQHFTWTDKEGKSAEATFRVTDGWHKVDGKWKLFHSHISFPIDAATGKAEMNLKE
jgi:ketosteroid isomerase-like protein